MAFSSGSGGNNAPMGDINVTPLVDVMLVLLIIFMVTAPMLSYQIDIDLPQPTSQPVEPKDPPPPIRLRIDDTGTLFWDNTQQTLKTVEILMRIESGGGEKPVDEQPTLEIETSPEAQYEVLAEVLANAKNAGMAKIGFVDTSL